MIIVPNGGAPEKLAYFGNRPGVLLFDNKGDDSNRSLFDNFDKYVTDLDNVLITSENQLMLLSERFNELSTDRILSKCIYMTTELSKDPGYLCSKKIFAELPNLGKSCEIIEENELEYYIDNQNYVIKNFYGSGSRGVHFYKDIGNIKKNSNFDDEEYLIQRVFNPEDYYNYTIPIIIKNGKLKHFIPILGDEGTYFMSKWKSLHIDGTKNEYLINAIQEIIDTFKITYGAAEVEIHVNKKDPSIMHIIDLNPRWSYDSSTCSSFIHMSNLSESYDHFNGLLDDSEFFVPDGFVGPKLTLGEVYKPCPNFIYI